MVEIHHQVPAAGHRILQAGGHLASRLERSISPLSVAMQTSSRTAMSRVSGGSAIGALPFDEVQTSGRPGVGGAARLPDRSASSRSMLPSGQL